MKGRETGTVPVAGADLHYEIRGSGPLLLMSQSGEGDANRSEDLVRHLENRYAVLTYDRRGLSRSLVHDPDAQPSMATHADDVHRLLAALTDEPALMLGCSMGAVIGLHLAVEHPGQLRALIAHEPVAPWLLGATERARHLRELEECQEVFRASGWQAALRPVAAALGIDPARQDVEPGVRPVPLTADRAAGFDYFIGHDFTTVRQDHLDVAALRRTPVVVVPASGRTTPRDVFDHKCAVELGALLGVPVEEFPGGHNGNMTYPAGYAARIDDIVSTIAARATATSRA
ncbi:alpha/beta hydrolase [Actinosynnema sp. NPDC023658]|uniref:alpha/beta fold hydrolase n=1 Tax=Actinosynnema sp. NPDC023658 TaxID=3155465 RepID=UPI0033DE4ABB